MMLSKTRGFLLGVFVALLLIGLGVMLGQRSNADPFAIQRAEAAYHRGQWLATGLLLFGAVLLAALCLGLLGGVLAAVRGLNRRAGEIHPVDGVFPVQRGHLLTWFHGLRIVTYFHDPNRAAGPTTVYAAVGAGDNLQVRQVPICELSPAQERVAARAQAVQAVAALPRELRSLGSGGNSASQAPPALPEPTEFPYPAEVSLANLLADGPSLERLALGVTVDQATGQTEIVRAAMSRLVHIAVGGSSGWGKSVFLRALAYQIALAEEPCDLAMIDLEGATFAPFARCGRLLYPLADDERDAQAILTELVSELDRRRELYQRYPGVDSLAAYNARAAAPLPAIVCLMDEATALLGDRQVQNATRTLALRARKYGLWLVLGGQDWKASSLDTAIRNQLSTRVQFRALSASQSRVLLQQSGAEALDTPGRALATLPGRPLVELQSPYIGPRTIEADVAQRNGGPQRPMPAAAPLPTPPPPSEVDGQAQRVRELHAQGMSKRQIALQVFGYTGGAAWEKLEKILAEIGDDDGQTRQ